MSDDIGRHKRHCPCLLAVSVTRLLYDMLRSVDDLCHVFNVGDVRDIDVAYVFRAAAIGREMCIRDSLLSSLMAGICGFLWLKLVTYTETVNNRSG